MAAFGGRGALSVRSGRAGTFELAIVSDALVTNTVLPHHMERSGSLGTCIGQLAVKRFVKRECKIGVIVHLSDPIEIVDYKPENRVHLTVGQFHCVSVPKEVDCLGCCSEFAARMQDCLTVLVEIVEDIALQFVLGDTAFLRDPCAVVVFPRCNEEDNNAATM